MPKIIYEPHPVSPARKEELISHGYKIIDAIFEPEDTGEESEDVTRQGRKKKKKDEEVEA